MCQQEEYRGRGLAKAVASRLLREKVLGGDGLASADVSVDNIQSRAVCKSLGGIPSWSVYCKFESKRRC
jgi:RimJ/RimL family protein N-acetyltransferase